MNQSSASGVPDPEYIKRFELAPLPKLHCGNNDCDNGLHCFRFYDKQRRSHPQGSCNECGARLVDWERAHSCNLGEANKKFEDMRHEWIRHYYWHVAFDPEALRKAQMRGRKKMLEMLRSRIIKGVRELNPFDGRGVRWTGDVINYARHATATCCRRCIAYWHGIPIQTRLTTKQVDYLFALGARYIVERMPELGDSPDPTKRKKPSRQRPLASPNKGRKWRP
ncbi:MAG TPA: DUF4186 family protein [Candidatus Acidoferrales bacterium]|nr:DUF4186 family protein [Candidatus Acidoferrales bacterium]